MLPIYMSHIQILHPREKFSLVATVILEWYLFQQKTKQKEIVHCCFHWKPSGKKGEKEQLHNIQKMHMRLQNSIEVYLQPFKLHWSPVIFILYLPRKAASAQTLIWYEPSTCVRVSIKASSSWRQHPFLHWTYTAASQVTRSWWHCNDWSAARLSCLVLPGWARTRMDSQ